MGDDLTAAFDQIRAAANDLAGPMAAMFKALIAEGVPPMPAASMTAQYWAHVVMAPRENEEQ